MPTLNADIPPLECFVRERYLHNLDAGRTGFLPCVAFSVASVPGRAIGFQVIAKTSPKAPRPSVKKRTAPQ